MCLPFAVRFRHIGGQSRPSLAQKIEVFVQKKLREFAIRHFCLAFTQPLTNRFLCVSCKQP